MKGQEQMKGAAFSIDDKKAGFHLKADQSFESEERMQKMRKLSKIEDDMNLKFKPSLSKYRSPRLKFPCLRYLLRT